MRALLIGSVALVAMGCKGIKDYEMPPADGPNPGTVPPPIDCSAYEFNGNTYNCGELDLCDASQETIPTRLACCDCDPNYCNPPAAGECTPEDYCVENPTDPLCDEDAPINTEPAEGCMECHNGSQFNDYGGTGLENPHWTDNPSAQYLQCTTCHGGNGDASGRDQAHIPRPPEILDDNVLFNNPESYFNYLTLTGVDKYPDYTVNGTTYTALQWLQFRNPSDLRVVSTGQSCGQSGCHGGEHATWFSRSPINTETGFYSKTNFTVGVDSYTPEQGDYYNKTAADLAFRAVSDPSWVYSPAEVGRVGRMIEYPERAQWGDRTGFYDNAIYDANTLNNFRYAANDGQAYVNQFITGSPLQHIVEETVAFQCGDCHTGSAGANNRYADFRGSGCGSCHMQYSLSGRSLSRDPNVPKNEPANADAIAAPERSHLLSHQIKNVAKVVETYFGPVPIAGISDNACVGCHQGSNRTVLQFWGIRLDQNQDVVNNFQYPANPNTFTNTAGDPRLFDFAIQNATFNGRNANQYLLYEDYDADLRDDTPPDVHYEAGLGCIDCHGSRDMHNGTKFETTPGNWTVDPTSGALQSSMDQVVGVQCESCHGDLVGYAPTTDCVDYDGLQQTCVADRFGNPLRNVTVNGLGQVWLKSRLDGLMHYIPQTKDTIVDSGIAHPLNGQVIYSPLASYAMGRADGSTLTGVGPIQTNPAVYSDGFSHMDNLACDSCHSSWTTGCIGCHLQLQYNDNAQNYFFSNTTGERIVVQVTNADFMYIQPLWTSLEVSPRGMIGQSQPGMKAFWRYVDQNNNLAAGLTATDRLGNGNNPAYLGRSNFPALSHNRIMSHAVRGKQTTNYEGGKECVVCHLNVDQINNFGANYAAFWAEYTVNQNYNFLADNNIYADLQVFIGQNTNNHLNHPYFVHMQAGLGTGLMTVDANGCPVNPLDANANRFFCEGNAPADIFDPNNIAYDLDRTVQFNGVENASFTRPLQYLAQGQGVSLRVGAQNPTMAGSLGADLLYRLADPNSYLILDSWIDANGALQGDAAQYVRFDVAF
jgi:hypothetical protein